jgi:hypothetical protein
MATPFSENESDPEVYFVKWPEITQLKHSSSVSFPSS